MIQGFTGAKMLSILEEAAELVTFKNYAIVIVVLDSYKYTGALRWKHDDEWIEISVYAEQTLLQTHDKFIEWRDETILRVRDDLQVWLDSFDKNRE